MLGRSNPQKMIAVIGYPLPVFVNERAQLVVLRLLCSGVTHHIGCSGHSSLQDFSTSPTQMSSYATSQQNGSFLQTFCRHLLLKVDRLKGFVA
jgi:hypothetical protein